MQYKYELSLEPTFITSNIYPSSCEVIRDRKTGDSLQYAFVEFENKTACESAYFKMDNVLIDDRRIHVDFSQSVSKFRWKGKGRLEIVGQDRNDHKPDTEGRKGRQTRQALGEIPLTFNVI